VRLYKNEAFIYYEDGDNKYWGSQEDLQFKDLGNGDVTIWFYQNRGREHKTFSQGTFPITDVLDENDNPYGNTVDDIINGIVNGGKSEVFISDQTTDAIIQKFNQVHNSTTLNGAVAIDDTQIIVTDATGIVAGSHVILFDPASVRFMSCKALTPSGTTIPIDRPLDFAFPDGTFVDVAITDMAVDGSTTTQIFGLRGTGAPPGVDLKVDITRIIITMLTTNAPAYNLFGDLPALSKGITIRSRNGHYHNIVNVKTNGEWAGVMYDLSSADAVNPNQGQNGWVGRMTFAGTNKMGVAIRLPVGEDLEILIQDDLSGLELFEIVAEGHIVEP
jgi:hypothetical protein